MSDAGVDRLGDARRPAPRGARGPCRRASRRARRGRRRGRRASASCARLKSRSIGIPSPVTSTFDGLTSRCRTPAVVGVLQRLGQPGPPPGDRPRRSVRRRARPARPVDGRRRSRVAAAARRSSDRDQLGPRAGAAGSPGRPGPAPASPGRSRACRAGAGRSPGRSGTNGPGRCACAGAGPGSAARASRSARPSGRPAGRRAAAPRRRKTRANAPRPSSSTRRNPAIVWPASGNGDRPAAPRGRGSVDGPARADQAMDLEDRAELSGAPRGTARRTRPGRGPRPPPRGGRYSS